MHDSVKAAFHEYSVKFEGFVHSMYVDVLGLVTTGAGNLIDPVHAALQLPWKLPDGSLASQDEIRRQWQIVKNDRERLKKLHWKYAAQITTIRLTDEDIDALVQKKLAENERYLERTFTRFDDLPADAQLGIHSLAWAAGPGFTQKFPMFTKAALEGRWWDCAVHGQLRATGPDGTPNPGVIPRNAAQKLCFQNAAGVVANSDDVSVLHWPNKYVPPMLREPPIEDPPPLAPPSTNRPFTMADAADVAREANRASAWDQMLESDPDETTKRDPPTRQS